MEGRTPGRRNLGGHVPGRAVHLPSMSDRVWEELSRTLRSSAPYRALLAGRAEVVRLPVPAAAWAGDLLARDLSRRLVAVVPREADAMTWMEAARLFGSGA